eukprot:scaffold373856_cov21-Prasinocladus_malaysianus.AAC.1
MTYLTYPPLPSPVSAPFSVDAASLRGAQPRAKLILGPLKYGHQVIDNRLRLNFLLHSQSGPEV